MSFRKAAVALVATTIAGCSSFAGKAPVTDATTPSLVPQLLSPVIIDADAKAFACAKRAMQEKLSDDAITIKEGSSADPRSSVVGKSTPVVKDREGRSALGIASVYLEVNPVVHTTTISAHSGVRTGKDATNVASYAVIIDNQDVEQVSVMTLTQKLKRKSTHALADQSKQETESYMAGWRSCMKGQETTTPPPALPSAPPIKPLPDRPKDEHFITIPWDRNAV